MEPKKRLLISLGMNPINFTIKANRNSLSVLISFILLILGYLLKTLSNRLLVEYFPIRYGKLIHTTSPNKLTMIAHLEVNINVPLAYKTGRGMNIDNDLMA